MIRDFGKEEEGTNNLANPTLRIHAHRPRKRRCHPRREIPGIVEMRNLTRNNDHSRGGAWQNPLLTLPRARFLFMSATPGDSSFFPKQLTALTGAPTSLVQSDQRPGPARIRILHHPALGKFQGISGILSPHQEKRCSIRRAIFPSPAPRNSAIGQTSQKSKPRSCDAFSAFGDVTISRISSSKFTTWRSPSAPNL